jgi:hypothetical protein
MRDWWHAVVVLVVGTALGLAVAGLPRVGAEQTRRIIVPTTLPAPQPPAESTTTTAAPPPTTPMRPPNQVRVRPYNATTVPGITSVTFDRLAAAGYAMVPGAFGPKDQPATTRIRFNPGFDREAVAVAALLGVPPTTVAPMSAGPAVEGANEADVIVLVGDDLAR